MTATDRGSIDYKSEIFRKGIHLCSLSIPVVYYFVTKELALIILIPLLAISVFMEIFKFVSPSFGKFYYSIFGFMLRDHEKDNTKKNLNGATYVLLSAVLVILIFPKIFVITSFTVLIISDISAALIGRKWGHHPFLRKSLEGTLAFFITAVIIVFLTPKAANLPLEYIIGIAAVAVGAVVENISYGFADDNLSVPLSVGGVMWLLYALFLPNLELFLAGVPN